jgi:multidrug resistance efflux pump
MITSTRKYLLLTASAILTVVLVVVFWPASSGRAQAQDQAQPKSVAPVAATGGEGGGPRAIKATEGDVIKRLVITGELQAERSIQITGPRISSSFASSVTYLAPEGASVRKGERIVEFDASSLLSQKSEAERRLDEAKLKIEKTKADLESQRTDFLNNVAQAQANVDVAVLYGKIPQDLLPINTYEKYQLDLDRAKLALQKTKEQLANFEASYPAQMALVEIERSQAEIDLKKIESDLAVLTIYAPQDGIVIYGDNWANNRKIQVGDSLFPGMPVVQLPDLNTMQVIGFVYDTELSFLAPGIACTFGLDGVPGTRFGGTIVSLTSVAGRKSFASQQKVFKAVIKPDSVDLTTMKPGMTTHVEVPIKLASRVLAVPREFLGLDSQGRYYVVKQKDSKTSVIARVEVGLFGDSLVEVLSGVSAGDSLLPVQKVWED